MTKTDLDKKNKARLREISRKRIWQKAYEILKEFNAIKHTDKGSYTESRADYSTNVFEEGLLGIKLETQGQFRERSIITVLFKGQPVFQAGSHSQEHIDPRVRLKVVDPKFPKNPTYIEIRLYRPGAWTRLLGVNKIHQVDKKRQREREMESKQRQKAQAASASSLDDDEVMSRLWIK